MLVNIDINKIVQLDQMKGDGDEDTALLFEMSKSAMSYIENFKWCIKVKNSYFGLGVGGIVAVFLFEIITNMVEEELNVWVIVGDIPPLYITTEDAPNPACALDSYIGAMEEWVEAVLKGKSVKNLAPVNEKASVENAKMLKSRLEFIDNKILVDYKDDLVKVN